MSELVERVAKDAGLDLSPGQVDSLSSAVALALSEHERAFARSFHRQTTRDRPSADFPKYADVAATKELLCKFEEKWEDAEVPRPVLEQIDVWSDFAGAPSAVPRISELADLLRYAIKACNEFLDDYSRPNCPPALSNAEHEGQRVELWPLQEAVLILQKGWEAADLGEWKPIFRKEYDPNDPEQNRKFWFPNNAAASLLCAVGRECDPEHGIDDCRRACDTERIQRPTNWP